MPSFTQAQDAQPVVRLEVAAWVLLAVVVTASRVAVAPGELYEWDSANYELGIEDMDVFNHRPHPPGYPVFVLLLRAARLVFPGVGAFLAVNAVLMVGLLTAVAYMGRPVLGRSGAWLLAAAISACPLLMLHGSASTAYVAEAFCSAGAAASCLAVLRGRLSLVWAAAIWAVLLGIRPNGALTLTPLMAWTIWSRPQQLPRAAAAFVAVSAGWFFPMVAESGGLGPFRVATSALSTWQFKVGSALDGDLGAASRNASSLIMYTSDALNLGLLLGLLALPVHLYRRKLPSMATVAFFAIWLLPSTGYYVLHHLPKSGYALTVVPGLALVLALTGSVLPRASVLFALAYTMLNAMLFTLAVPIEAVVYNDAPELVPDEVWVYGDYSARGLQYQTRAQRQLGGALAEADPRTDSVVFLTGTHELHRLMMATHPEFELVTVFAEHGRTWSNRGAQGFGAYQLEVLAAPKLRGTDYKASEIFWDGNRLVVERMGDRAEAVLGAERVLLVLPCAPCLFVNSGSVEAGERVDLGAGFVATWLRPNTLQHPVYRALTP